MRLALCVALLAACGGGDSGSGGGPDAIPPAASEPCDFQSPGVVQLGAAITASSPSAMCASGLHFYRFTPAVAGIYSIAKSGGGSLGYCEDENDGGCICANNVNCCTSCTLEYALPSGDPLPAGSNNQIYIAPSADSSDYSFTVTGPN